MTTPIRNDIDGALDDLEQLADEVRVKVHLAELDAREAWEKKVEPRVHEARRHAKHATASSKASIEEALIALRELARVL